MDAGRPHTHTEDVHRDRGEYAHDNQPRHIRPHQREPESRHAQEYAKQHRAAGQGRVRSHSGSRVSHLPRVQKVPVEDRRLEQRIHVRQPRRTAHHAFLRPPNADEAKHPTFVPLSAGSLLPPPDCAQLEQHAWQQRPIPNQEALQERLSTAPGQYSAVTASNEDAQRTTSPTYKHKDL